jgi:hypothetical protein
VENSVFDFGCSEFLIAMASHALAYFAVIGVSNHKYQYRSLPSATANTLVPPSEIWLDAITDVTVIFFGKISLHVSSPSSGSSNSRVYFIDKEESVPNYDENTQMISMKMYGKEWELIRYTVDGLSANCNCGDNSRGIAYLGIQRRRNSGRLDHICDVRPIIRSSLIIFPLD